jgi:hypothetical protein
MRCPNCSSQSVRKASSIVDSDTHYSSGTFSGGGVASDGPVAVSGTTASRTTSKLAQRLAPPSVRRRFWPSLVTLTRRWTFGVWLLYYCIVMGNEWSPILNISQRFVAPQLQTTGGVAFLLTLSSIFLSSVALIAFMSIIPAKQDEVYMRDIYPGLLEHWQSLWYCYQCGSDFQDRSHNPNVMNR